MPLRGKELRKLLLMRKIISQLPPPEGGGILALIINHAKKNINLKKYHKDTTNIVVARLIASDIIIQRKESVGSVHILMVQCLVIPIP